MDFAVFCAQIRDQQAPKATVTVYLKRLEAAGFVRREIEPSDRRRHRLLLTPARVSSHHGRLSNAFNERLGRLTVA
jgi:DNA-binding IclR family transcriptional regulator